jgi:hypothetical protein
MGGGSGFPGYSTTTGAIMTMRLSTGSPLTSLGHLAGLPTGSEDVERMNPTIPTKREEVTLERRIRWLEATIELLRNMGQDIEYEEGVLDRLLIEAGRPPLV